MSDQLIDDTTILDNGSVVRPYKHLETVGMYSSAWINYPNKYKFISYTLNVFDAQIVTQRKTMNWKDWLADTGGLVIFIQLALSSFVSYFAEPQYRSYIASRLYTWIEPDNITKELKPEKWAKIQKEIKERQMNGETVGHYKKKQKHIVFLDFMGLRRVWYRLLCGSCYRDRYWNTYKKAMDRVDSDMERQMDIV